MTALLMIFFIIIALTADVIVRKYRAYKLAVKNAPFVHANGLLPTMADGGKKLRKFKFFKN